MKSYLMTYGELEEALHKFNCRFANASKGHCDVEKLEPVSVFMGFGKKEKWVHKIRIPLGGKNEEVPKLTVKKIREICQLRKGEGIDSKVFYSGVDPLQSYIKKYERVLRKLAFR